MAAPAIPPIRLGPTDTGLAVEKLHRRAAANSTIDAPSDLVCTGGAIGNHTASNPEIPLPPEPDDSAQRAAVLALDPVPGAGPVPLWRSRGPIGLFDELPVQRISSSASFAA